MHLGMTRRKLASVSNTEPTEGKAMAEQTDKAAEKQAEQELRKNEQNDKRSATDNARKNEQNDKRA